MGKPIIPNIVDVKTPITGQIISTDEKWSFSFEYFNQIEYFGLGNVDTKWFVSLIEKLKILSQIKHKKFEKDLALRTANRYHKIDWTSKNVPYQRKDFTWVRKEIIENDDEFPFFQFQISMGLGRIIGFWDLNKNFQIVLLDPMHNMQPSKRYDYKVNDTSELQCEITSFLIDFDNVKKIACTDDNCRVKEELIKLPTKLNRGNFVYFVLDDDYHQELSKQLKNKSLKDIIEIGLLSS